MTPEQEDILRTLQLKADDLENTILQHFGDDSDEIQEAIECIQAAMSYVEVYSQRSDLNPQQRMPPMPLSKEKVRVPVENTRGDDAHTGQELKTESELKSLRGELEPGYLAFVPLDEKGNPSGPAEDWEAGKSQAAVFAPPPRPSDELVTPSGAPITNMMNPNPDFVDANLLERNPIGGVAQAPKETDADAQRRLHAEQDAKLRERDQASRNQAAAEQQKPSAPVQPAKK